MQISIHRNKSFLGSIFLTAPSFWAVLVFEINSLIGNNNVSNVKLVLNETPKQKAGNRRIRCLNNLGCKKRLYI